MRRNESALTPTLDSDPLFWRNSATKLRFWIWSVVVAATVIYVGLTLGHGYHFSSSILTLLPETDHSVAEALAAERLTSAADRKILFILADRSKSRSASAAQKFVEALTDSHQFASVRGKATATTADAWHSFYQSRHYQLLSPESRRRVKMGDSALVDESLGRLYSPLAAVVGANLIDDPLQLFFQWQTAAVPRVAFAEVGGWLTRSVGDQHYRLVVVELLSNPYDVGYQRRVLTAIDTAKATLPSPTRVLSSGLILHAAHGAEQARGEISTIGIGSLVGITLLLLVCFRSAFALLLALLPILVGCIVALALCLLIFKQVHLITLVFGAGLIGVAVDYSLHYLCAYYEGTPSLAGRSPAVLRRIFPSLLMGLVSSVLAYAAQAITPFPGLRQMAAFSAFGLVGAWLTVVCWLPVLQQRLSSTLSESVLANLRWLQNVWPRLDSAASKAGFFILTIMLVYLVSTIEGNDNLRLLQTSSADLLEETTLVHEILDGPNMGQYFILNADNEQTLLQLEERFSQSLYEQINSGTISGFMATSRYVPSLEKQTDNRRLLAEQVYEPQGLLSQLVAKGGLGPTLELAQQRFEQTPFAPLRIDEWLVAEVSQPFSHLWIGEQQGLYYSLISLSGIAGARSIERLASLAQDENGIRFVDRISTISQVLTHYRQQLSQWLLLAYAVVLMMLIVRYRGNAWRIIAAPTLASLLVLSALEITGSPVTVFHNLALLLILGIGLDASIFLQDSRNSPYAWLAVTLSSLTTLLAFGLLALSATPVLQYFGETVLLGIIFVWLLVPCFIVAGTKIGSEPRLQKK
ncbi:MAG: hypothetical protein DRQ52_10505 [Gammaproteobacteria bacterium]|nr:MAG: hypothetical protein DRQ52_10505 [Gammaproteobacteria bacterium]